MRKFTLILSLLVTMITTAMAQTTYYTPGERKSTFEVGDKVFIYNTCLIVNNEGNVTQNRTNFFCDNGSKVTTTKKTPRTPLFYEEENSGHIWEITSVETGKDANNALYYKVSIKAYNGGYLGIDGVTNNSDAKYLYIQQWNAKGAASAENDVASENTDGTTLLNSNITDEAHLFSVRGELESGDYWNGNSNSFAKWSKPHPFAFYTADVADVNRVYINHINNSNIFSTESTFATTGSNTADVTVNIINRFGLTAGNTTYSTETVQEGTTITVTYTTDDSVLPYNTSNIDGTFGNDVKWYYMDIQRSPAKSMAYDYKSGKVLTSNITNETTRAARHLFAFTGNAAEGFEIYNYMAGATKVLWREDATNGGKVFFTEKSQTDGNTWILSANGASGYVFRLNGYNEGYLNDHIPDMAIWNSGWGASDPGSTIQFTEVTSIDEFIQNEKTLLAADITTSISNARNICGTGIGKYTASSEFETKISELESFVANISEATFEEINAKLEEAANLTDLLAINQPTKNKFYRLKGNTSGKYIKTSSASGKNPMTSDKEIYETTIYLDEDGKIMSFATGLYLLLNHSNNTTWNFSHPGNNVSAATFTNGSATGTYRIAISGRQLYDNGNANESAIDAADEGATGERYDWIIEEMSYLPVKTNSNSINVATFYSPIAISTNTWSQRVKAYTGEVKDGYVTLTQITKESNIKNEHGSDITAIVIPANTPVYLERVTSDTELTSDGCTLLQIVYDYEGTLDEDVVNDFRGTFESKNVEEDEIYVLGIGNGAEPVIGLYKAAENYSNGFKAYLPAPATGAQGIAAYGVRYAEDTTGIDEVVDASENVKAVYDLTGRRVESINAPGIYIVNGKKVVIK